MHRLETITNSYGDLYKEKQWCKSKNTTFLVKTMIKIMLQEKK